MENLEELRRRFAYDPTTGFLTCAVPCRRGSKVGDRAGSLDKQRGYRVVGVNGVNYKEHRLIWFMVYGELPEHLQIDHVNGKKDDNRLCNLRLATQSQNNCNIPVRRTNKLGIKGVERSGFKYRAHIVHKRKKIHLGVFDTPEEASEVFAKASVALRGDFAKGV